MLAAERRQFILDKLQENESVNVNNLSKEFEVSKETIRRDLEKLQNKNLLKKIHGGAVPINKKEELSFNIRKNQNTREKREIAKKALKYIKEGDTIFLDISSTVMFLARELKNIKNITVITNSAQIVTELANNQDINVISTGGILVPNSLSFVGPHANSMVNNYFADKFFASCKGISARYGATDSSDLEIEVKENMVARSSEVIILADYSKFKERGLSSFAELNKINKIISDSSTSQAVREEFLEKGLEIE